jgi:thiosulfate/3-mercaptopyruvate sulfurtransferase
MPFTTVIAPADLAAHLDDPEWVVFDCRFTLTDPDAGRRAFEKGHIPGARYAHLDDELSSPVGEHTGRHPLPDPQVLAERLGAWGVDNSKQVVVYDDSFGAIACRMWWLLRWLGHDAVAVLDGGLPRWERKGHPLSAEAPGITPARFEPRVNDELWVDADFVGSMLGKLKGCGALLDARAEERFTGDIEPLDKVAGHVPGAVNQPYDDNLAFSGDFLPAEELREQYESLMRGCAPDTVIHMCGSGVTACHNVLAMEVAGLHGSRLYAGSWSEWITDPRRPVATGASEDEVHPHAEHPHGPEF